VRTGCYYLIVANEKQALADLFSGTSATHDAVGGLFGHFGVLLVEHARLSPGDRVLDVAAGTGASLVPAAQRVGANGHVIGLDLAPGMVDRLRDLIARLGIKNAEAVVGDAESLPFESERFDAVLCGFGLFFFADTDRALAEIRRVLRPGGQLAISTFTRAGSDSMDAMWARLAAFMPVPPAADRERRFDEPRHLLNTLVRAGFKDGQVEPSPFELVFPDIDTWLSWLRSMEFGQHLARMTPAMLEQFRQSAASDFFQQTGGPGVRLQMDAYLTHGRKPGTIVGRP
jgi:ubiquinone/menaquinone biosynthesis C-methylase UbiE